MAANTSPIYALTPRIGTANPLLALTKSDGTGVISGGTVSMYVAFTAGSFGSWVSKCKFSVAAIVAGTATTGTVGRVYYSTVNTGATTGGTDTWLIGEVALPQQTADSATVPTYAIEIPINMAIPSGSYIHVSTHAAAAANTVIEAMVVGGDY